MASLKNGASGNDVKALQEKLVSLGFKLIVDGSYGKATEGAVIQLQKIFGATADGIAGDQTKALIEQQVAAGWNFQDADTGTTAPAKSK